MFDPTTYASRALTIAAELEGNDKKVQALQAALLDIHDDLVGLEHRIGQPRRRGVWQVVRR